MPNLDFYALGDDYRLIFDFVFQQPGWTLRESGSRVGEPIRVFTSTVELLRARPTAQHQRFVLWAPEMRGRVTSDRIDFEPETARRLGGTHRFASRGWGLISLSTGLTNARGLTNCHTNHNTEKRALKWAPTYPEYEAVDEWDWAAVQRVSSKLNRHIAKIASSKLGSRPVLPAAHDAAVSGVKLC